MNEVNVFINGKLATGAKGDTILQLCQRKGIEIPTLCHDPRLEPYTSCFVCVVEVEGMRTLQPSCSSKISEGMSIMTDSAKVRRARKAALDLLLSNHYADCMAPCKERCPANVDVQGYISLIEKEMYSEAVGLIKEVNPLPAICGRVCVRPCESVCRRNLLGENNAVGIDYLKRYAADNDMVNDEHYKPEVSTSTDRKIAIIGAGPAGLSAAYFLQQKGHQVDIFESSPAPGGMLRYGIPPYRLPNEIIDKETSFVTELGVNIFYKKKLGENISYKSLKYEYDAIILAIGSQKGTRIGCEGDDAENVLSGIDFLRKMEMDGKQYDFSGKKVAVIGGGNTAMDCCRTAMRCGAEKTIIIYRRTENEMPANKIEIHESKLEGVEYHLLTNPIKINKNEKGQVKSVTCQKMTLGEPDASGRRRPIPEQGSDFEIEVDFVLAAIGQKTVANFVENINHNSSFGRLNVTKWGDIEADKHTLQTGIPSIFAAGDGVTGPATLIEAVAQAKIAARSCHQYLMASTIEPLKHEFLSKKDNFRVQNPNDYTKRFEKQLREEMPTLAPELRKNFNEVELGYTGNDVAFNELQRCLECGCVEYFTCDLKRYCSEYDVEQKRFDGVFNQYSVDFSHPFIEIDNNKCILCSRCVRICKEVVGANALGLVNRGCDTFVAPALGNSLTETDCESCGLCISTCPTGAITENTKFKPGPVKLETFDTLCNYCSVGCKISIHHYKGFVFKITGADGQINKDTNICRYAKFGYQYMNDNQRITKPLLKVDGKFEEISFERAFDFIFFKTKSVKHDQNAFFAGARLTNEEIYLIQKLARGGAKTNNISSFHYLDHFSDGQFSVKADIEFEQIANAEKVYLLGSEINYEHAVVGYIMQNAKVRKHLSIELITTQSDNKMKHKVDTLCQIHSYYHFIKAINHYIITNNLEKTDYIEQHVAEFTTYKESIKNEDFNELINKSGVHCKGTILNIANDLAVHDKSVVVFAEKELTSNAIVELYNLALITGKTRKETTGIIGLKEKNNSRGLYDFGAFSSMNVGGQAVTDQNLQEKIRNSWKINDLPTIFSTDLWKNLENGELKNIFIFGEDPVGCAIDKTKIVQALDNVDFKMVSDYFLTETAQMADLVLPASFPFEQGGSFTNTQGMLQKFNKAKVQLRHSISKTSLEQLLDILAKFDLNSLKTPTDVMIEAISLLPVDEHIEKYKLHITNDITSNKLFDYGCDNLVKIFDEYFEQSFA